MEAQIICAYQEFLCMYMCDLMYVCLVSTKIQLRQSLMGSCFFSIHSFGMFLPIQTSEKTMMDKQGR